MVRARSPTRPDPFAEDLLLTDDWQTLAAGAAPSGPDPARAPTLLGGRYRLGEHLASGSASAVHRGHDTRLDRPVAIKLTAAGSARPVDTDRHLGGGFRHPALVRLLDAGVDDDRAWQVFELVLGGTCVELITALHGPDNADLGTLPKSEATRREAAAPRARLPHALFLLCEAAMGLGAAHRQGLVHLDLKPDNIMYEWRPIADTSISAVEYRAWLGEGDLARRPITRVLVPRVIDWGIGRRADAAPADVTDGVPGLTHYMAPERIRDGAATAQVDVYALGAVLYHLLGGHRPYHGWDRLALRQRVLEEDVPLPPLAIEGELAPFAAVCAAAMSPDPARRPADGEAFARALRRAQALGMLVRSDAQLRRSTALRAHAVELRGHADAAAQGADAAKVEALYPAWALEEKAAEAEVEANLRESQWFQSVRAVLGIQPDLIEARGRVVQWASRRLLDAVRAGEAGAEVQMLELLRTEVPFLDDRMPLEASIDAFDGGPDDDPRIRTRTVEAIRIEAHELIDGHAWIDLRVPDQARVEYAAVNMVHRRLEVEGYRVLGRGALSGHRLAAGRCVLRISAPDHHPVLLPLHLMRGERWSLRPPGEREPLVLPLAPLGALADDDVYVPAGWAWIGGERFAADAVQPGRRVWIDGFVMKADPVTHGEWIEFLDALSAAGEHAVALACQPQPPARPDASLPTYAYAGHRWSLTSRPELRAGHLRMPVAWIDWDAARRYTAWRAERDGLPWRLPCEWEYEKAARCGDTRRLPWGEHLEPRWTRVGGSTQEMYGAAPVDAPTGDVTVHGIRWLVGNVQTWCLDPWSFDGPPADTRLDLGAVRSAPANPYRMLRGAAFFTQPYLVSGATRFAALPTDRSTTGGVRLVRSHP